MLIPTASSGQNIAAGGGGGSAPVFESSAVAQNSGADVTVTKPSGTTSGDLLLAFICNDLDISSSGEYSLAGWTEEFFLGNPDVGLRANNLTVLSKVAGGSEPANYTFTAASVVDDISVIMVRVSGQGASWNDTITTATAQTNTTTPASEDFTPTVDNCLVIQALFSSRTLAVDDTTTPTGYSGQVNSPSVPASANDMPVVSVCWKQQATAAATGSAVWWASNTDATSDHATLGLAIAP